MGSILFTIPIHLSELVVPAVCAVFCLRRSITEKDYLDYLQTAPLSPAAY